MRIVHATYRTVLALVLLAFAPAAAAQEARGFITGTVSDPTGAVVVGANVEVENKNMGTKQALKTNQTGLYVASFLIPGFYKVTVNAVGFTTFIRDDIQVRVNDRVTVNISLAVAGTEATITVVGDPPLLQTESASLGTVVDGRRAQELPIAHGNPYALIGLASGVAFTRNPRLDRPFEPTHSVGFAMDGTRANRSDVMIDGVAATATAGAGEVTASYVPPADLVAEFKVQTATFDAQFGQTEGGVTNISMKSGTNQMRGTLYYQTMRPELIANDFFANRNGIPRPDFFYHRYGGTIGGPIRIPKLYDGRNRTFFMYGLEGIREGRPRNDGTPTVPTPDMRNGDFSGLLGVSSAFQVFNPFSRRAVGGGRFRQDPFPGNIVPRHLFDPVGHHVLQTYYPNPTSPGNPDGTLNFLRPELKEFTDYLSQSVRFDHSVTDSNRLFVRLSGYDRDSDINDFFGNRATGQRTYFGSRAATIDNVHSFNATTVLNVRYGLNRFVRSEDQKPGNAGFNMTELGFPAALNDALDPMVRRFPRFTMTGYQGITQGGNLIAMDTHNFSALLTKMAGKHSIKFGMEFRSYRENTRFRHNDLSGEFNFGNVWTRGPMDNSPAAPGSLGQSVAAMLMGLPNLGSRMRLFDSYAQQSNSWGLFIQDDWRVTRKLTVNLGLRWEYDGALTERFNRSVRDFDSSYVQPFEEAVRAAYARNPTPEIAPADFRLRGGLTFAGVGGEPRTLHYSPRNNFMPRVGFAYQIDNKTIFRGGYGAFFGFLGQRRGDVMQIGFNRDTPMPITFDMGVTFHARLANPFPDGLLRPLGAGQGFQTFAGNPITFFNENPLRPQMHRWQMGFQRELPASFVLDVAYVGNKGTHIEMPFNMNATPQRYLSRELLRDQPRIDYLAAAMPNPFRGHMPEGAGPAWEAAVMTRGMMLNPFPHFGGITNSRFDGYSWYHALQVGLEKRMSHGFTLGANYTWSKFMTGSELMMPDDIDPVEVISPDDRPHRLTVSGLWELPVGKGKRFLTTMPRLGNALFGNWQLSGIYTYQTGPPIGFGNIPFSGADINDIVLPSGQRTVERWFNTEGGFVRDPAFALASNVRYFPLRFSFLRAHHISNFDLSAIKTVVVKERYNMQFRFEALNAFNRPLFPSPNVNPVVAQFGQAIGSTQANYARQIQLMWRLIF